MIADKMIQTYTFGYEYFSCSTYSLWSLLTAVASQALQVFFHELLFLRQTSTWNLLHSRQTTSKFFFMPMCARKKLSGYFRAKAQAAGVITPVWPFVNLQLYHARGLKKTLIICCSSQCRSYPKNLLIDWNSSLVWKLVTWIQIYASLNQCKKMKAEPIPLVPRKFAANLQSRGVNHLELQLFKLLTSRKLVCSCRCSV